MESPIIAPVAPFRDAAVEGVREALTRRGLLGLGGAMALLGASGGLGVARAQAGAAAQPHAFDDFYAPDQAHGAVLSPSGARVAILRDIGEGETRRMAIDLVDADNPTGERRRVPVGDFDVEGLAWGSDRRVLVRVKSPVTVGGLPPGGSFVAPRALTVYSRRLVSVDVETGTTAVMFGNERQRMRESLNMAHVIDYLPDDPDHILMAAVEFSGMVALHRVNVNTGRATLVERGAYFTMTWAVQDGAPVMRIDANTRRTFYNIFVRPPGQSRWRRAWRQPANAVFRQDFRWITLTDRPGVAIVAARLEGEDVLSVRELDLDTVSFGPPLSRRDGLDVEGWLVDVRGRYLGAAYQTPWREYDFTDPVVAPHHRAMSGFFGGECNVIVADVDVAHNRFVIRAEGPREPGSWYLYDRVARHFEHLASRTLLDTRRLSPGEALRIETRDGVEIEAVLTAPPSGAPGPLVVLVHGGPEVRDWPAWNRQAQTMAAQGWWVLQPNFRGSGGYGQAFAAQGWRRWGTRMQEDVEDAVDHVIALKGLDAGRVAIMGSSYGGYAALMGAVRRPGFYKAAISICGLGDLDDALGYENRDDDTPEKVIYGYWSSRIGDQTADAALIASASPRLRAAEITCPVLLVHGADDQVVQVGQSRRMNDALRAAGKRVHYIEIARAGHGDWDRPMEKNLMERYVAFFAEAFA